MKVFSEEVYKKVEGIEGILTEEDNWAYGMDGRTWDDLSLTPYAMDERWFVNKKVVEKFEVGKWYKFNGKEKPRGWNRETMNVMLDHKPRLCVGTTYSNYANFEGVEKHQSSCWVWGDLKQWEEVEAPNEDKIWEDEVSGTMTEHEICRKIVSSGDCNRISCSGGLGAETDNKGTKCPLFDAGRYYCANSGNVYTGRVVHAQLWLDDHPVKVEALKEDRAMMTEHDICERIVGFGNCTGINCHGEYTGVANTGTRCPLMDKGTYKCTHDTRVAQAQHWLNDHAWKPVRGEMVLAGNNSFDGAVSERIYLATVEGAKEPYICVATGNEPKFAEGKPIDITNWKFICPIPPVKTKFDTAKEHVTELKARVGVLESYLERKDKQSAMHTIRDIAMLTTETTQILNKE